MRSKRLTRIGMEIEMANRYGRRDREFVQCNCENANCGHTKSCDNWIEDWKNKILYIGPVCDTCYARYPKEDRVENERKHISEMECSRCFDVGKTFVTTSFQTFWDHQAEHDRRGDKVNSSRQRGR